MPKNLVRYFQLIHRILFNALFVLSITQLYGFAQNSDALKQHYESAAQFARVGDTLHAAAEYRAFIAEALHRIANGRADLGEFSAAKRLFQDALAFAPDYRNAKFDFAKACLDADDLPKARELTEELMRVPDPTLDMRLLYARVLFHLGEFQYAREQLEQVFAEKPEFNTGYLLAKTYLLLNREERARRLFAGMADKVGDTAQNHIFFGRAYSETDYKQQAIEEFRRAISKDNHAPDVHYYLALTYLGHNEAAGYAPAIPEFRAELQNNPSDFRTYYMLGYIALKQRNFAEAETELKQALTVAPADLQAMLQLAEVYEDLARNSEAEQLLQQAVSQSVSHAGENEGQIARAHYLLGRLLEKAGRHADAMKEMATVTKIQKRLGPSSMQSADNRTKEAQDETRRAQAIQSPEKVQQLETFISALRPAIADAYNNLGVIAAGAREFAAATTYFEKAGDWDSSLDGLDRNLGRAAYLAGDYDKAAQAFSRYLRQHPEDNSARATLGLAWFKLADYQKVVDVLNPIAAAIQSNPDVANAYKTSLAKVHKN